MTVLDNETPALGRAWHCVAQLDELGQGALRVELLGETWELQRGHGAVTARRTSDGALAAAVVERFGLVFLAAAPPLGQLPEFPGWDDPAFVRAVCDPVRTPVSVGQLIDNFMDAAHFPFVHAATFGVVDAPEVSNDDLERDGWTVRSRFSAPYRNHDDPKVATGEHPLVQPHQVLKVGHAGSLCELELRFALTGGTFWILYCCTPERNGSTRVYKLLARNDVDAERLAQVVADEDAILVEDLVIMERFRAMCLALDLTVEVHTRADRLSVAWRRLMAEFLDAA